MYVTQDTGIGTTNMAWEEQCRREDMAQRALENERWAIDDARRSVDEKSQQLKAISNLSALIGGFAMVVLVEIQMPGNVGTTLLIVFAVTTSLVVAFMLVAMLNATWTMVAILRYDCVTREVPFEEFWRKRCQSDFIFTLRVFSYGAPLFMCVLAELGWVLYWNHEGAWLIASPLVTAVALCSMIFWFSHTDRKWSDFLMNPEVKLFHPPT